MRQALLVLGTAVGVLTVNVAISFVYVAVYAYVIEPGHDNAFYQAHAQFAAPYSSIIAGMPLMYLAGRWIGLRALPSSPVAFALGVWLAYALIDLAIVLPAGDARLIPLVTVSLLTKLAAAYSGGAGAKRRLANADG